MMKRHSNKRRGPKRKFGGLRGLALSKCHHKENGDDLRRYGRICYDCGSLYSARAYHDRIPWEPSCYPKQRGRVENAPRVIRR
jgi:hypothetical protein